MSTELTLEASVQRSDKPCLLQASERLQQRDGGQTFPRTPLVLLRTKGEVSTGV